MAKVKNEIAVGIMFFVATIILGYFTIAMKDDIFDTRDYYKAIIEFPSVFGLQRGDNVKVFGVNSGSVDEIELKDNNVYVHVKLYNNFTLYENYDIKIRQEGMLSGKCITIMPGYSFVDGKNFAVIDKTKVIKGMRSQDLIAALEDVISENRDNIRVAITNLREITENLRSISGKIEKGQGTIGKLINQDELHEDSVDLVSELRESIEDAREQAPITSFIRTALTAF